MPYRPLISRAWLAGASCRTRRPNPRLRLSKRRDGVHVQLVRGQAPGLHLTKAAWFAAHAQQDCLREGGRERCCHEHIRSGKDHGVATRGGTISGNFHRPAMASHHPYSWAAHLQPPPVSYPQGLFPAGTSLLQANPTMDSRYTEIFSDKLQQPCNHNLCLQNLCQDLELPVAGAKRPVG